MTETEFPCGAYDSRTAKNENKQMPANNADVQMEHPGENSSDPALSSQSGYADATLQKIHPSIKKDDVQMEHSGVSGSDSALSSQSGYAAANPQKLHPSINKKDNVQMELSGVSGSNSVLSSPSGYAAANPQKLHPSMKKMWAGRTAGVTDAVADDFNSSIRFDQKMYRQDIRGSMAHAAMLGAQGIIPETDAEKIIGGLEGILADLEAGRLQFDPNAEDIHMFVETVLTERLGDVGKRLHTARSRNDQVALDTRMYLRDKADDTTGLVRELIAVLCDRAEEHAATIMPGYTHMQRAQPVTFGHHLMAYAAMLMRDLGRLHDCRARMNISPIGCCALAGTTYATDRRAEAAALGFDGICANSLDGVSDRDFCVELCSALAILMMHLSRLSEELVLWSSWEFGFVELSDAYTTGSSIMPQKKNPDMAELIRGKTGRVYGDLIALLTVLKGLPLAYNKDMQEDKESIFDAVETAGTCLSVMIPMIATMTVKPDAMKRAAQGGFINATDLADYLVTKGMPFRAAYKISGELVARCIREGRVLEELPLAVFREYSELFGEDVYPAIDLDACVMRRISEGGTSPDSVRAQIASVRDMLKADKI